MKKIITTLLAAITIMSCGNNAKKAEVQAEKAWQEIAPTEIELNPVRMMSLKQRCLQSKLPWI